MQFTINSTPLFLMHSNSLELSGNYAKKKNYKSEFMRKTHFIPSTSFIYYMNKTSLSRRTFLLATCINVKHILASQKIFVIL